MKTKRIGDHGDSDKLKLYKQSVIGKNNTKKLDSLDVYSRECQVGGRDCRRGNFSEDILLCRITTLFCHDSKSNSESFYEQEEAKKLCIKFVERLVKSQRSDVTASGIIVNVEDFVRFGYLKSA